MQIYANEHVHHQDEYLILFYVKVVVVAVNILGTLSTSDRGSNCIVYYLMYLTIFIRFTLAGKKDVLLILLQWTKVCSHLSGRSSFRNHLSGRSFNEAQVTWLRPEQSNLKSALSTSWCVVHLYLAQSGQMFMLGLNLAKKVDLVFHTVHLKSNHSLYTFKHVFFSFSLLINFFDIYIVMDNNACSFWTPHNVPLFFPHFGIYWKCMMFSNKRK